MNEDRQGPSGIEGPSARGLAAKREYVRDLVARADAQAIASLAECMCDESWFMRDLAEAGLLELGSSGAPALMPLLEEGLWFTRTSAARTLGRLHHGGAVPALVRLAEDVNDTVAAAAREALVQIGLGRGAIHLAHVLHNVSPGTRERRLAEIEARDRRLCERILHMMQNEELMSIRGIEDLTDDSPQVRGSEEGVEWEVLTGPPPPLKPSGGAGGRDA